MKFFKQRILVKGVLALVMLGFLVATVPFYKIFHTHHYNVENSKITHISVDEVNCCDPIKIQSHFDAILSPQKVKIKLSFLDNYTIQTYNYSGFTVVKLNNKAPPLIPIV